VRRVPNFAMTLVSSSWWLRRLPGLAQISNRYVYDDARPYPLNQEFDCESINGSCFVIRADFLEEIGYLDQGTFLYYEEIILGKQIKDRKRKACLVTSTVIRHYQGATSGHRRGNIQLSTSIEMIRSEVYYCRKYLRSPRLLLVVLISVRVVDIIGKLAYQWFQGIRVGKVF